MDIFDRIAPDPSSAPSPVSPPPAPGEGDIFDRITAPSTANGVDPVVQGQRDTLAQTLASQQIQDVQTGRGLIPSAPAADGSQVFTPGQATAPQQLSPQERRATVDAYRNQYAQRAIPDYANQEAVNQAQIQQGIIQNNSALQNFSGGVGNTLGHVEAGLVQAVNPQAGNRLAEDLSVPYNPDTKAGFAGEAVGNILPLVPAMMAGPAGINALTGVMGASQFGNVRGEVARLRAEGKNISTGEELSAAALSGLVAAVGNKVGLGAMTSVEKAALEHVVANGVLQYAKAAGINTTDMVAMTMAQNAIDKSLGKDVDVSEGLGRAALTGAVAGTVGRGLHSVLSPAPSPERATPSPFLDSITPKVRVQAGPESRGVPVEFEDATDKAAYIASQPRKGKAQAEASAYLKGQGLDEAAVAKRVGDVQVRVDEAARGFDGDVLRVAKAPEAVAAQVPNNVADVTGIRPASESPEAVAPSRGEPVVEGARSGDGSVREVSAPVRSDPAEVLTRAMPEAKVVPAEKLHADDAEVLSVHEQLTGKKMTAYEGGRGRGFSTEGENFYSPERNKTPQQKREAVAHEATHWLQDNHPELVTDLDKAIPAPVREKLAAEYDANYSAQEGKTLDPATRDREVQALVVGRAFARPSVARAVIESDPGVFTRVADKVLTKLRSLTAGGRLTNQVIETLRRARDVAASKAQEASPNERTATEKVSEARESAPVPATPESTATPTPEQPASPAKVEQPAQSKGHLKYVGGREYFRAEDGTVMSGRKAAPLDKDGYRSDRVKATKAIANALNKSNPVSFLPDDFRTQERREERDRTNQDLTRKVLARPALAQELSEKTRTDLRSWLIDMRSLTEGRPGAEAGRDKMGQAIKSLDSGVVADTHTTNDGIRFLPSALKRGGNLPDEAVSLNDERRGSIAAETTRAKFQTRALSDAVKTGFGVDFHKLDPAKIKDIDAALKGRPVTLPPEVQTAVQAMRDNVDTLTQRLMQTSLVDPRLAALMGKNLGQYLNRSYRVFDDPKWAEKVPPQVMANAVHFVEQQLLAQGKPASQAPVYVDELLQDWKSQGVGSMFTSEGKLGAKNLSVLKPRQGIAPEIRALMGEYENPLVNYSKSVAKMATLLSNHAFLEGVKSAGSGDWLFTDDTAKPGFTTRIAAPSSSTTAPLNGMRTSPEIAEAFQKLGQSSAPAAWARVWGKANFIWKSGQTVYSMMTQMRNMIGQPFFWLNSGHYNVTRVPGAFGTMLSDVRATGSPQRQAYVEKLTKLGILGQGVQATELFRDLQDAGWTNADLGTPDTFMAKAARAVGAVHKVVASTYQATDAFGKVLGFESELARAKEANPSWTTEQQEKEAAERVLNTYPTYSRVPAAIQSLRRQPIIGPFVSFWSESLRTMGNSAIYAAKDIASGNPALMKHGAQRAAGLATVVGSGLAVEAITKALLGMSDDEEAAFRKAQPVWSRGHNFMYLGRDGKGNVRYIDVSALNPYNAFVDTLNAVLTGGKTLDVMAQGAASFFGPLLSTPGPTQAVVDIKANKTESGGRVYNPEDSEFNQWRDIVGHVLANTVEPGTLRRLRTRIVPGLQGKETSYGDKINPGDEILGEVLGVKPRSFNFASNLSFQGRKFGESGGDVAGLFLRELNRPGTPPADITSAYRDMEERRFKLWSDMADRVRGAQLAGVSKVDTYKALVAGGVGPETAKAIITGRYTPYNLRSETMKAAVKKRPDVPFHDLADIYRQYHGRKLSEE